MKIPGARRSYRLSQRHCDAAGWYFIEPHSPRFN